MYISSNKSLPPCPAHSQATLHTLVLYTFFLTQGVNDNWALATDNIHQIPLHPHHRSRLHPFLDNGSCSWGSRVHCSVNFGSKCCVVLRCAATEHTIIDIGQWNVFAASSYDFVDCLSQVTTYSCSFTLLPWYINWVIIHHYLHSSGGNDLLVQSSAVLLLVLLHGIRIIKWLCLSSL